MNTHLRLRFTRRQALAAGACGLLAGAFAAPFQMGGGGRGTDSGPGEFNFLVVNDLHVVDDGCADWLKAITRQMQAQAGPVDFCLLLGDLAHDGAPDQLALARDAIAGLGVPVYPVIGNHDQHHPAGLRAYESLFPGRINYHFEHRGWQFVGLDTTDGTRWDQFPVRPHTLQWLEATLPELNRNKPTVLFTHFPLGPDVFGRPTNAAALLSRFKGHNLKHAFCGHSHRLTWRRLDGVTLTTNRCCSFRTPNLDGVREKAYFLCRANTDGSVSRRYLAVHPA